MSESASVAAYGFGRLHGVGLGPGDPELLTLKAVRLIGESQVVAYFAKKGRPSNARRIASSWIKPGVAELELAFPVTTEIPFDEPAYSCELRPFYDKAAREIAAHLSAGRDVALICEGDPLFYGSFMHIQARLKDRFAVSVCAGITGMSGCWTAAQAPMSWGDDVLTVIPGTLPRDELARRLIATDAAVVMKLGRNLRKVREVLIEAGLAERAIYVERGTTAEERVLPLAEKKDDAAPYFALILVPGEGRRP
ncbi:MAG: precorrin-2 C(20)-methyltransferase [Hyphomicrobiales bacterium]|nr:precorrin-2 C(20)-methyltransferase [Hyphomicrobiales bacterium]